MIDVNTFLLMMLYVLGSILLVVLIILAVRLIGVVDRFNKVLDNVEDRVVKFDRMFNIVDIVTDNMALVSDKVVDLISGFIRKLIHKKDNGKEEVLNEEE